MYSNMLGIWRSQPSDLSWPDYHLGVYKYDRNPVLQGYDI